MEDGEFNHMMQQINNENILNNLLNIQQIEQVIDDRIHLRRVYRIRKRLNPFEEYDEGDFRRRFRFTKNEVHELYGLINGDNTLEPQVIFFNLNF